METFQTRRKIESNQQRGEERSERREECHHLEAAFLGGEKKASLLRRRPRLWGTAIAVEHREEDEEAVAAADIISPSVSDPDSSAAPLDPANWRNRGRRRANCFSKCSPFFFFFSLFFITWDQGELEIKSNPSSDYDWDDPSNSNRRLASLSATVSTIGKRKRLSVFCGKPHPKSQSHSSTSRSNIL